MTLRELDLGDKGVLQVGSDGQRWLFAKDGTVTQPSDLAPDDLVDVWSESGVLFFLGARGGVFLAKEALGKIEAKHAEPAIKQAIFRAGRKALLGVQVDGTVHRSTDAGATWSATKLSLRPAERVVGLGANDKGLALVLLHPQRVLVSTDDGVTWSSLATPGIGARDVRRDRNQDLFLCGSSKFAKLTADPKPALVIPAEPALKLIRKAAVKSKADVEVSEYRSLAGDRHVTIGYTVNEAAKTRTVTVGIAPLGALPSTPATILKDAPASGTVEVSGHRGEIVAASRARADGDNLWRLKRTVDDGHTWEDLGEMPQSPGSSLSLLVGPAWVAVGPVCKVVNETTSAGPVAKNQCTPARVKIGDKGWQDLGFPSDLRFGGAVFDVPRKRVVVTTVVAKKFTVLHGKIDDPSLSALDALPSGTPSDIAFDSRGTLRLLYGRELVRFDANLKKLPSLHLPFAPTQLSLTGDRGFAQSYPVQWETNDGGDHWAQIAGARQILSQCVDSGCLFGEVMRVGWELPSPMLTLVPSTPEPASGETPEVVPVAPPPVAVSCTPKGPWTTFPGYSPVAHGLAGDVRFLTVDKKKDGSASVTVARGSAPPKTFALLGPDPPKPAPKIDPTNPKLVSNAAPRIRFWAESTDRGCITARYTFSTEVNEGKYNPVDVELGWYSAVTSKAGTAKLPHVPAFRAGSSGASALLAIGDNGVLFMPDDGIAPLYRVGNDGKVTTLGRPPVGEVGRYTEALDIGGTVYLVATQAYDVAVASSSDGKTWKTALWSTGDGTTLRWVEGKPRLLVSKRFDGPRSLPRALFGLETLGSDPPEPKGIEIGGLQLGTKGLVACSAKALGGLGRQLALEKGDRSVAVEISGDNKISAPMTLGEGAHIVRIADDGSSCIDSVFAWNGSQAIALVSPHDLAHGWLVRPGKEATDGSFVDVRSISCVIGP